MFMVADSEETTYDELSQDQKAVIHAFAADLSQVVSTYGISPLSVDEDDLDEDDIQNNRVWSVVEYFAVGNTNLEGVEDDAYKTDAMLAPGVEEGALTYHVAKTLTQGNRRWNQIPTPAFSLSAPLVMAPAAKHVTNKGNLSSAPFGMTRMPSSGANSATPLRSSTIERNNP
jgi:hypothetical protein